MSVIKMFLQQRADLMKLHQTHTLPYGSVDEFVLKYGREFEPGRCEDELRIGAVQGMCFRNSVTLALRKPQYVYVEGFAMGIMPVNHAWCFDTATGLVVDPTWTADVAVAYFGIPFELDYVINTIELYKKFGVIDNWENGWPIFSDPTELWLHDIGTLERHS